MIILVRHAEAVPRKSWSGDDHRRPLTPRGERQAEALIKALADYEFEQLVVSPTERCKATVAPIAAERDLHVKTSRRLSEGHGSDTLDLVLDAVGDILACTHGDVVDDVLNGLRHLGWPVPARPGRAKGSTWLLSRESCEYVPPPG